MTQSIKCLFKTNHQDLHKRIGLVLCACNPRTGEFLAGKLECVSSKSAHLIFELQIHGRNMVSKMKNRQFMLKNHG